jgi:hypothetical protein
MKVFYEVLPPTLGRVMYRIRDALLKHAPPGVVLVKEDADVQIVDVIGPGGVAEIRSDRGREYVVLQHTWLTSWRGLDFWKPVWDGARLVVSYHDLPYDRYLRLPWGVDFDLFRLPERRSVKYGVLTTGYDARQEAIDEPLAASAALGWPGVHIGGHAPRVATRLENVSDEHLVDLYGATAWVAGLRRVEGFELPALEGLACGARPLLFDTAGYRYWYGDHAVYVPEVEDSRELTAALIAAMRPGPVPVTVEERESLRRRFDWQVIASQFWEAVLR